MEVKIEKVIDLRHLVVRRSDGLTKVPSWHRHWRRRQERRRLLAKRHAITERCNRSDNGSDQDSRHGCFVDFLITEGRSPKLSTWTSAISLPSSVKKPMQLH